MKIARKERKVFLYKERKEIKTIPALLAINFASFA